jgi:type III secretory pathway component EscU
MLPPTSPTGRSEICGQLILCETIQNAKADSQAITDTEKLRQIKPIHGAYEILKVLFRYFLIGKILHLVFAVYSLFVIFYTYCRTYCIEEKLLKSCFIIKSV